MYSTASPGDPFAHASGEPHRWRSRSPRCRASRRLALVALRAGRGSRHRPRASRRSRLGASSSSVRSGIGRPVKATESMHRIETLSLPASWTFGRAGGRVDTRARAWARVPAHGCPANLRLPVRRVVCRVARTQSTRNPQLPVPAGKDWTFGTGGVRRHGRASPTASAEDTAMKFSTFIRGTCRGQCTHHVARGGREGRLRQSPRATRAGRKSSGKQLPIPPRR